jgi:hypothetical protein
MLSIERGICPIHHRQLDNKAECLECCGKPKIQKVGELPRTAQLYISNTTAIWAKEQLQIIIDMLKHAEDDEQHSKSYGWIYKELQRIRDGIKVVK